MFNKRKYIALALVLVFLLSLVGCAQEASAPVDNTITVKDQLGRTVTLPKDITKVTGTHIVGPNIIYALGEKDKLVDQGIPGLLGTALCKVDPDYAAKPTVMHGASYNIEEVIALNPQVSFVYVPSNEDMIDQFENAGIKAVAIKGETIEDSYEAIRLIAKVLNCEDKGEAYIVECNKLLQLVEDRLGNIPEEDRPRVMFAGPKSVYTVASGEMLNTTLLEMAGAVSVSKDLKGSWTEVSPEQVATWNPDIIILGSSLDIYGDDQIYNNPHFKTVKAIQERKVYSMPSNIGWWDFPAPNCVLGVVWMAKKFYPDKFADIDMTQVADDFYKKCYGYTFTEMGGKLE